MINYDSFTHCWILTVHGIIIFISFKKERIKMVKVKMNVQTAYHGDLLRAGKVYEVDEETAERWIASKLAEEVDDE